MGKNLPSWSTNSSNATAWNCDWDDQFVYAIGMEFDATDTLHLRAGYNYGKSPLSSDRAFEAIAFPAIQEQHYTVGIGWDVNKKLTLNAGFMYAPENTISGSNADQFINSYETSNNGNNGNKMMIFKISFAISFAIFVVGILYRVFGFFQISIGPEAKSFSFLKRVTSFLKSLFLIFVNPLLFFKLCKSIVLDVVLQKQLLSQDFLKWCMHIFIYCGFTGLVLIHALEDYISEPLFTDYYSTLNPFMLLRNVLGVMVILGLIIAIQRRKKITGLRLISKKPDYVAIVLIAVIMISGFLLEASKIISAPVFDDMVDEWGVMLDDDEIANLKVYWQESYGVIFPNRTINIGPESLEEGEVAHDNSCADCHSRPVWAFVSYPISIAMRPMAGQFNAWRLDIILWYIHFLSCFIGLAYLPFSKLLHIITSPISILINGIYGQTIKRPENRATGRALALHSCTHCGTCTLHCSVAPVYKIFHNDYIFPSEKLLALKERTSGASLDMETQQKFAQGSFFCTNCNRCSALCPVGINLQDLWIENKKDLAHDQFGDPCVDIRKIKEKKWSQIPEKDTIIAIPKQKTAGILESAMQSGSFSLCYSCMTCTNSCPIVGMAEDYDSIGMAPHQIMHSLSLGLIDMVMDSRMIWDCLTCYKCQENCPQDVQIADIFYEIKNKIFEKEYNL